MRSRPIYQTFWEAHKSVETIIMESTRKLFFITYGTPLMNNVMLHQDLVTLAYTEESEQFLSISYETPVDVEPHFQVTIYIIKKVAEKFRQGEISPKLYRIIQDILEERKVFNLVLYIKLKFGHCKLVALSKKLS